MCYKSVEKGGRSSYLYDQSHCLTSHCTACAEKHVLNRKCPSVYNEVSRCEVGSQTKSVWCLKRQHLSVQMYICVRSCNLRDMGFIKLNSVDKLVQSRVNLSEARKFDRGTILRQFSFLSDKQFNNETKNILKHNSILSTPQPHSCPHRKTNPSTLLIPSHSLSSHVLPLSGRGKMLNNFPCTNSSL